MPRLMGGVPNACKRIADSQRFQLFILAVIVANAITLGLATYNSIDDSFGTELDVLDGVFLGIFVIELTIRILAYGRRPQDFFKDGWNVFDFCVIGAVFIPGIRENVTLLRLARLLRVVRVVSVFPDLRILVRAMVRSLPPIGSLALLTAVLIYAYGMVGWILFHEQLPKDWGTIGDAMLSLFVMLTLENWPHYLDTGQAVHPASWIFFVSYILIASFLVINILLAIIINSMEEVRAAERERDLRKTREKRELEHEAGGVRAEAAEAADAADAIAQRVKVLRDALEDLERDLGVPETSGVSQITPKGRLRP